MPADTNSTLLGLLLQGTGNNSNTWGANLNDFVFTYLENAIAGYTTKAVTGGAATLTAAQHRTAMLEFTGTLSSNSTVTIDNTAKRWRFFNNTSGSYVLLVKTASGTAIEIPQGTHKDVICDGSDNLYRLDEAEVGNFIHHGGTTAPAGTLACEGGTFVRADHPDLFAVIGETWGAGNGTTTAGLPDLTDTNRFLRAADGTTIAVGDYQANQNKSHTHTGSGTSATESAGHTHTFSGTTGSMSANASHSHSVTGGTSGGASSATLAAGGDANAPTVASAITIASTSTEHTHTYSGTTSGVSATHTHTYSFTTSTGSADGTEARPEAAGVLICIKI